MWVDLHIHIFSDHPVLYKIVFKYEKMKFTDSNIFIKSFYWISNNPLLCNPVYELYQSYGFALGALHAGVQCSCGALFLKVVFAVLDLIGKWSVCHKRIRRHGCFCFWMYSLFQSWRLVCQTSYFPSGKFVNNFLSSVCVTDCLLFNWVSALFSTAICFYRNNLF